MRRGACHATTQAPEARSLRTGSSYTKGRPNRKGRGKGRIPKDDNTKKKEVHFTNFNEMASKKLMGFLCKIVQEYELEDYLEVEEGVPVMYTFGKEIAKACVLRCTTEQKAKEVITYLRGR